MKASELKQKTMEELTKVRDDLFVESFNLRIQKVTGQLAKHDQIRKVRRDIARINTIIAEKGKKQ